MGLLQRLRSKLSSVLNRQPSSSALDFEASTDRPPSPIPSTPPLVPFPPVLPSKRPLHPSSLPLDLAPRRLQVSDPSFTLVTPPTDHSACNSSNRVRTYRDCLGEDYSSLDHRERILARVRRKVGRLIEQTSEPEVQSCLRDISFEVIQPDVYYDPYPGTLIRPKLEFLNQVDLGYMAVTGGKDLKETVIDMTTKEIYRRARLDPLNPIADEAIVVRNRISLPDQSCVAHNVSIKLNGTGLSSHRQHSNASSRPSTTPTKIKERVLKKRVLQATVTGIDAAFCATSLVVEIKTEALFKMLSQLLAYLVQAYEICGCRLGMIMFYHHFTRLFMVEDGLTMMETSDSDLWGRVVELKDVKQRLRGRRDYCAHKLGQERTLRQPLELSEAGIEVLTDFLVAAAKCLVDLPFGNVTLGQLQRPGDYQLVQLESLSGKERRFRLLPRGEVDERARHERYVVVCGARPQEDILDAVTKEYPDIGETFGQPGGGGGNGGDKRPPGGGPDAGGSDGKGWGGGSGGGSGGGRASGGPDRGSTGGSGAERGDKLGGTSGGRYNGSRDDRGDGRGGEGMSTAGRAHQRYSAAGSYSDPNTASSHSVCDVDIEGDDVEVDEEEDDKYAREMDRTPAAFLPSFRALDSIKLKVLFCSPQVMSVTVRQHADRAHRSTTKAAFIYQRGVAEHDEQDILSP